MTNSRGIPTADPSGNRARLEEPGTLVYAEMDASSPLIAELSAGTEIGLGKIARKHGIQWVAVALPDGRSGYMKGSVRVFRIKRVTLLQKEAPVREAPSVDAPVVRTLVKGDKFDLMEVVKTGGQAWVRIRDLSGRGGFLDGQARIQQQPLRVPLPPAKNLLYGAIWCIGGIVVTAVTYDSARHGGGTYFVAWGAIAFGGIQFLRGLFQLFTGK